MLTKKKGFLLFFLAVFSLLLVTTSIEAAASDVHTFSGQPAAAPIVSKQPDSDKTMLGGGLTPVATKYTVTVLTEGNGIAFGSHSSASSGTNVILSARANPGYHFSHWVVIVGGITLAEPTYDNTYFPMPESDVTVRAYFASDAQNEFSITMFNLGNGVCSSSLNSAVPGDLITVAAVPLPGHRFVKWNIFAGGITLTNKPNEFFIMPSMSVMLQAVFEADPPLDFSITMTSSGNGTAYSSVTTAQAGASFTVSAQADPGYHFKQWNVLQGGIAAPSSPNATVEMPAADVALEAVFEPNQASNFTINLASDGEGVALATAVEAAPGTAITVSARARPGNRFAGWQIISGGISLPDKPNTLFVMPAADVSIVAIFTPNQISNYTVTATASVGGQANSSVNSSPAGQYVVLTAIPDPGYYFKDWQVLSGGISLADDANIDFVMPAADVSVNALFEPLPANEFAVVLLSEGGGAVHTNLNVAKAGAQIDLTAHAEPGNVFVRWEVISGGVSLTDTPSVSFTMPASNVTIKAVFQYTGGGTIGGGGIVGDGGGGESNHDKEGSFDYLNSSSEPESSNPSGGNDNPQTGGDTPLSVLPLFGIILILSAGFASVQRKSKQ